jgi:hypothetical protein
MALAMVARNAQAAMAATNDSMDRFILLALSMGM